MPDHVTILIILTSHSTIGDTGRQTGVWLEELTTPYYAFLDAGANVDIASIAGGKVPIDPHSLNEAGGNPTSVDRFLKDAVALAKVEASTKLADLSVNTYDAVFLPGGHGTMWDMPENPTLSALLSKAWAGGKVVAAVCHGPAGLIGGRDLEGRPLVAGRRISAFTNDEEDAAGLSKKVPFLLESRLRVLGARYEKGPAYQPFALRDGKLITGQNPASSKDVAELTLAAIRD